jgi:8-amino-7-oxononanoate synthase
MQRRRAKIIDPTSKHPEDDSPDFFSSALVFERQKILPALRRRDQIGSLRRLKPFHKDGSIDFSSNDYLGLAQNQEQHEKVERTCQRMREGSKHNALLGSTGSRLLTGDSDYAQTLEARLAKWHKRPAALLCNSGYDANLSVLSCLTLGTVVLMDALSHNSLQMGVRLSKDCTVEQFLHNDLEDLKRLLEHHSSIASSNGKPILVVAESVYSMDGDLAPLREILDLSLRYNASVIVDEAHGLGVFGNHGMGVLERDGLEEHPALLLSIHTFGKAAGCHGAVICGSKALKEYLLNYGRPIIYSTSLPIHSLVTVACSYQSMAGRMGEQLREIVQERVRMFRRGMSRIMGLASPTIGLVDSISPIQALIIPGNVACVEFCNRLWDRSKSRIRLYPIRSPTVPIDQERVRIIVHAHNTASEIASLLFLIELILNEMGYLQAQSKL